MRVLDAASAMLPMLFKSCVPMFQGPVNGVVPSCLSISAGSAVAEMVMEPAVLATLRPVPPTIFDRDSDRHVGAGTDGDGII